MNRYDGYSPRDILKSTDPAVLANLLQNAEILRLHHIGNRVHLRGLIEFSNYCRCDCLYCGLRKSNLHVPRYHLDRSKIVALALQAQELGLQSIALQSGEMTGSGSVDFLAGVVSEIKDKSSRNGNLDLGITLSVGELTYTQYKKLFDSGAHRYLLRIETSNRELFENIHPPGQLYQNRLECLQALKDIGYQVGTGVMIGLPGQSVDHLIEDLDFFIERDIDMLGMGPYLPQSSTPLAQTRLPILVEPTSTTLKMMALARIFMPDINMVASTALQSIAGHGLQMGLKAGANILMPVLTPEKIRDDYCIYDHKQFKSLTRLQREVEQAGYHIGFWQWGDSRHYYRRRRQPHPELELPQGPDGEERGVRS